MRIIKNTALLKKYAEKTNLYSYFDSDISSIIELIYYEPEEYIIDAGEISKYLLFMVNGECRFFAISADGTYVSFGAVDDFDIFGEVSSLWGLVPASNVQAVKPTYCIGIRLSKYREILLNDNRFLRYLCQLISTRVVTANEALTTYVSAKAESRLANYISQHLKDNLFTASLKRCSEAIGISYRHLIRLMNSFCDRGILSKSGRKYYVINTDALTELTSDAYFTM